MSHAAIAAVVFLVPGLVQLVVDPVVFMLADRFGRPRLIRAGLAAMAASLLAAALAPGPAALACALAVSGVATGAATALTQAMLVDAWPDRQARTMARWTLLSTVGDFLAPVVLGALAIGAGVRWRLALAIAGAVLAVWSVAVSLRGFAAPGLAAPAPDDDEPSLWQAVRAALADRVLLAWLFGQQLCDLLDEILVVFASLHLRVELGASPAWQAATIGAFVAGGAVGLVALDRLLIRHDERRLVIGFGLACAAVFAAWLTARSPWLAAIGMAAVGATSAPLYPLAAAQAYARYPGRAGVVSVAGHVFAPVGLALPWLLGVVADRTTTMTALALLIIQPLGLVALAAATSRRRS